MAPVARDEGRLTVIEGRPVRVFERVRPIAPTLDLFLNGGRGPDGHLWQPFRVLRRFPLRIQGPRPECLREDHRLGEWLEGFYPCSDGVTRQLRLQACADCGAVCIRDISFDTLPVDTGRLAPRRRDHIVGWFTGARPGNRVYT